MARKNRSIDVFRHVNMQTGPMWTDPETGEQSRCWPFTGALNSEGRPWVTIAGKKYLAYRLTWELVNGEELGDRLLRHKCDNQICCNPAHGVPGDHVQNMDDMKQRERHGMSHHMVKYIKRLISKGVTDAQIMEITGVSKTSLLYIKDGTNYSHVKLDDEDE